MKTSLEKALIDVINGDDSYLDIDVGNEDSDDPTFNPEAEGNEHEEDDSSDEDGLSEDMASWVEYKSEQEMPGTRKKDMLYYLGFRKAIADFLLQYEKEIEDLPADDDTVPVASQSKRARNQHPSNFVRTRKLEHLPIVLDTQNRCRLTGCKSTKA
ncbi:unnamed protein product [Parnassius apollo]|uniref:(apollo) hypothetical protein n=1 Tax=Parnassius apollo TaxID=110799 RepID=A0A8S3WBT7_PARAO|nr:unnamed protein product [Parnassius apollo]